MTAVQSSDSERCREQLPHRKCPLARQLDPSVTGFFRFTMAPN